MLVENRVMVFRGAVLAAVGNMLPSFEVTQGILAK